MQLTIWHSMKCLVWRIPKLKQLDPFAKVIGPTYAAFFQTGMTNFLSYQKAHNTLPDIVSWHQLLGQNFNNDFNTYRLIKTSLGINPRPLSINEYSDSAWFDDEGRPGVTAPLIVKFERLQADTAMQSLWNSTGTLGSILTNSYQRNGGWWFISGMAICQATWWALRLQTWWFPSTIAMKFLTVRAHNHQSPHGYYTRTLVLQSKTKSRHMKWRLFELTFPVSLTPS